VKEGKTIVRKRWRSRFVYTLIVYCAGFATAIYCLAPGPAAGSGNARTSRSKGLLDSVFKSDEFARSVNAGLHKYVELGKDAAAQATERIKREMKEAEARSDK